MDKLMNLLAVLSILILLIQIISVNAEENLDTTPNACDDVTTENIPWPFEGKGKDIIFKTCSVNALGAYCGTGEDRGICLSTYETVTLTSEDGKSTLFSLPIGCGCVPSMTFPEELREAFGFPK